MENMMEKVSETADFLREKMGGRKPVAAVVLGTGLHAFVAELAGVESISYSRIPHFPESTVEFHKGELVFGAIGDVDVVVMQGRFHYYEGYTLQQVTFPIRVLKALGVAHLLISNAAGGMNKAFKKGDLVLVTDHINLLPDTPLRGVADPAAGQRFTDMSEPYSSVLNQALLNAGIARNTALHSGVYVAVTGPNLETKAEYRWLRNLGADMVGMSTVPEVIVAAQIGLPCAAVSVITDECDPDNLQRVNIAEIIEVAGKADQKLSKLFRDVVASLPKI